MKFLTFLFAIFLVCGVARAAPPSSVVIDDARILSEAEKTQIVQRIHQIHATIGIQIVVWTVPKLDSSIEEDVIKQAREWGIGKRDLNNGVVFAIAPNDKKMRIEVGYGLEGTLTDSRSAYVLDQARPFFRKGQWGAGILTGLDHIEQITKLWSQEQVNPNAPPSSGWLIYLIIPAGILILIAIFWVVQTRKAAREQALANAAWEKAKTRYRSHATTGRSSGSSAWNYSNTPKRTSEYFPIVVPISTPDYSDRSSDDDKSDNSDFGGGSFGGGGASSDI